MSGADLVAVADKRLALAEAGGIEESHQHIPVLPRGPSIGNPAPLGLLCFGMTTGKTSSPRFACIRTGGTFKLCRTMGSPSLLLLPADSLMQPLLFCLGSKTFAEQANGACGLV